MTTEKKAHKEKQEKAHKEKAEKALYAAVMLKGTVKIHRRLLDTLKKLNLHVPNTCAIYPADATHKGMLTKANEFVAWGEVSEAVLEKLIEKRGGVEKKEAKAIAKKALSSGSFEGIEAKTVFRLSPPSGGIRTLRLGRPRGDMGYRGEEINKLIEKMV